MEWYVYFFAIVMGLILIITLIGTSMQTYFIIKDYFLKEKNEKP